VRDELPHRIATEPLEHGIGKDEAHHGFADDGRGRYGTDVAALDGRWCFFQRREIDRTQRLHERRDRFHVAGHAKLFAVGHAAFESAGTIRRSGEHRFARGDARAGDDLVVDALSRAPRGLHSKANPHRLDRRN
jgi:hypothetical protein